MIEITYTNGDKNIFEIYNESNTHIMWKDYARNFIIINKNNNKSSILIDGEWVEYDLKMESYRKL